MRIAGGMIVAATLLVLTGCQGEDSAPPAPTTTGRKASRGIAQQCVDDHMRLRSDNEGVFTCEPLDPGSATTPSSMRDRAPDPDPADVEPIAEPTTSPMN